MEAAETAFRKSVDGSVARILELEGQVKRLQEKLDAVANARKVLDTKLAQAMRDSDKACKELAERTVQQKVVQCHILAQRRGRVLTFYLWISFIVRSFVCFVTCVRMPFSRDYLYLPELKNPNAHTTVSYSAQTTTVAARFFF